MKRGKRARHSAAQRSAVRPTACCVVKPCASLPGLGWGSRVHPHPSNHDPSLARFVATRRAAPPGLSPPIIPDPNPKSPNKAQVMELDPQSRPPSVPVARRPQQTVTVKTTQGTDFWQAIEKYLKPRDGSEPGLWTRFRYRVQSHRLLFTEKQRVIGSHRPLPPVPSTFSSSSSAPTRFRFTHPPP